MQYRIALGADHRGFALKELLRQKSAFGQHTIVWHDEGTYSPERTDYPLFAHKVIERLLNSEVDLAILTCGSGIGESIAANRFTKVYAGLVWQPEVARMAKEDDNVNVLILPADYITIDTAIACIEAWLSATFKGGRYQERLAMIEAYHEQKHEQKKKER